MLTYQTDHISLYLIYYLVQSGSISCLSIFGQINCNGKKTQFVKKKNTLKITFSFS